MLALARAAFVLRLLGVIHMHTAAAAILLPYLLPRLASLHCCRPGIAFNPADDPLLQRNSDSDTDSEAEAFRIRDDDLLILAARNEDDVSHLEVGRWLKGSWADLLWLAQLDGLRAEGTAAIPQICSGHVTSCRSVLQPHAPAPQVWVYEPADERGPANLFVHHSLMLPAFPLSVAWLDCDPTGRVSAGGRGAAGLAGLTDSRLPVGKELEGRQCGHLCTTTNPGCAPPQTRHSRSAASSP